MSKSKSKSTKEALAPKCTFRMAVEGTSDVAKGYCHGLQALENADKTAVKLKDKRKVGGSLNIDKETKYLYPNDPRWDYAVGYDDKVFFIEVHPANTSNIPEMKKKKEWLKKWLQSKAPLLDAFPSGNPKFLWAATESGVHISNQASYMRKLAQLGFNPKRPVIIG